MLNFSRFLIVIVIVCYATITLVPHSTNIANSRATVTMSPRSTTQVTSQSTATPQTDQENNISITKVSAKIHHFPVNVNKKKLIKFGWDDKNVDYISKNIRRMEKAHPYLDGVRIRYGKDAQKRHFFDNPRWTEEDLMIKELEKIDFHVFKHNFLNVSLSSTTTDPDWFSNSLWKNVLANTRLASKALQTCKGCDGIILDTEYYEDSVFSYSPWIYNKTIYSQSFEEVKTKVYQRGQQFMKALRTDREKFDILVLHSFVDMWKRMDRDINRLADNPYALLPAFIDGMLDQAGDCKIVDGAENLSYYIDETLEYRTAYQLAIDAAKNLLSSKSFAKLDQNLQISMAMYPAHYVSNYKTQNNLSEQDITKWLIHNVYNSLLHADEYAWIFTSRGIGPSKKENWWTEPVENLPAYMIEGYTKGKNKFENARSLGYDMVSEVQNEKWVKVGIGYDGSKMTLYINDKDSGSTVDGLQKGVLKNKNYGYVGYSNSSFPYFKGVIDEVKFFGSSKYDRNKLLGHWSFDTVINDKLLDSSPRSIPGIGVLKGEVESVSGKFDNALYFNGKDSQVRLGKIYEGKQNSVYAEAWIKPSAVDSTTQTILGTSGINLGLEFHHICGHTITDKFVRICDAGNRKMPQSDLLLGPIPNVDNGFELSGSLLHQGGYVEIYVNSQPVYKIEGQDYRFELELEKGNYVVYARYFAQNGTHYPSNYLTHIAN